MPGYHDSKPHYHRLTSFSVDAIEKYFAQLNPIAERIAYDINDTKANYGQLWNSLDYHEQNDIINDSLIKPEISLRYFDNFLTPSPTNSSRSTYQSSTDSLAAIVLKNVDASRDGGAVQVEENKKNQISLKSYEIKFNMHDIKNVYSYDGRNLHTFFKQKIALKINQDDTVGHFYDEHSRPFCYRTKSQINIYILPAIAETKAARKTNIANNITTTSKTAAGKDYTPKDDECKKVLDNYNILQHQLRTNLKAKKSHGSDNLTLSSASIKPSSISTNRKILKSEAYKLDNSYNAAEESSNLLQHCGQSDLTMGSCSSTATSDDEKTLEEDVHLLDSDSNIRKGFDFLNNW